MANSGGVEAMSHIALPEEAQRELIPIVHAADAAPPTMKSQAIFRANPNPNNPASKQAACVGANGVCPAQSGLAKADSISQGTGCGDLAGLPTINPLGEGRSSGIIDGAVDRYSCSQSG